MAKRPQTKWDKAVPWIISAAGLALLVFAGYMLVTQLKDYSESEELYEDTHEEYVSVIKPEEEPVEATVSWEDLADVDVSGLREINEDVVGWIYFEDVEISYPVLYSRDNSKYLRTTYTGESLTAGSIFIEGSNNSDFSDAHTIIYGHNMSDYSMFGRLEYYVIKADYIKDHEYFQIITEKEKYRYKIISYKIVGDDDDIYTVYHSGGKDFTDFVREDIMTESFLKSDYCVNESDHIITLSTCFRDDRLVISAVRCDERTME